VSKPATLETYKKLVRGIVMLTGANNPALTCAYVMEDGHDVAWDYCLCVDVMTSWRHAPYVKRMKALMRGVGLTLRPDDITVIANYTVYRFQLSADEYLRCKNWEAGYYDE